MTRKSDTLSRRDLIQAATLAVTTTNPQLIAAAATGEGSSGNTNASVPTWLSGRRTEAGLPPVSVKPRMMLSPSSVTSQTVSA